MPASTTTPKNSRSEQARINGSKSKGPVTIEGKAASSKNALKHGFAAVINIVLTIEDKPAWERHLDGYRQSFEPRNYAEETLIDQLAGINWRQSRLVGLETALIDAELSIQRKRLREKHPHSADDPYFRLVQAWQSLAAQPEKQSDEPKDPAAPPNGYDVSSIELVRRYLVSLDRQYRNTLLNLRQIRKDFATPNEPKIEQPPADQQPTGEDADLKIRGPRASQTAAVIPIPPASAMKPALEPTNREREISIRERLNP
ncbi:MAG TPA: hypothetical protein VGL53_19765 [Bryobacteraceae bacterium]|jgi:hypothetical protein